MQRGTSLLPRMQPTPSMVDLSHLAKEHGTQKLHTFDNKNTFNDLNDMLFWENLENRRTRKMDSNFLN